jgi:phosphomannomutase
MLFITFDRRIQNSKANTIITTPSIPLVVKEFIEDGSFPLKQVENYPGEISRQIREERACFAAADTLKFYFPEFSPFSDGNFILLKILEIMTTQDDLLSSLTRGFPKGSKLNKTVPISSDLMENIHNRLREVVEENGYNYHDIINELKIIDDGGFALIKVALHRNALIISVESEDKKGAQTLMSSLEKIISEL